jgi:peptidoglycan hydrolase-like protein with peptidoglycan-binding domain
MPVRTLLMGSKGEDVKVIQDGLNRNGADLDPDGDFGTHTRDAVIDFQKEQQKRNPKFGVDGKVGRETRLALFPLVGVTVNVYGMRLTAPGGRTDPPPGRPRVGFGLPPLTLNPPNPQVPPPPSLNLKLPPLTFGTPRLERIPGLLEPIAISPMAAPSAPIMGADWQQVAQTQRQFKGLFRGPVVDSFAIGIQTVFNKSDADNHVEYTTGCLLQSPIGFQDGQGNNFTLACFANATWVDPILHLGMFHLANPYAQAQVQGNLSGQTLPTVQLGGFPININVDLNDDGLQLNFTGGAVWNLTFEGDGFKSTWGTQLGVGLVARFRSF